MKLMFPSRGSHCQGGILPPSRSAFANLSLAVLVALTSLMSAAQAQVGFSASLLGGLVSGGNNKASKVTSLQFGPDNRLYFMQVNGTIIACDVVRLGPNNYVASNAETISLVKNIPNYDDDGNRNLSLTARQATGILVVGTALSPVIYASSCDPREGAGSGAVDLNLDTNSGVISRLTRTPGGVWEKVDIVRGLPRSEENHACNGLNIDATGTVLYLAQGGNTNAGGPSNNFAFSCETALAAAVLSIDLTAINALPVQTDAYGQQYLYDLPTVNDPNPSRAHNLDGSDVNDPFGGNDGLNQAKLVAGGPVQVYASGFRNPYDVLIAKTPGKVGKMYTFDNAGNSGWGGYPKNEAMLTGGGASLATNEYVPGEPGTVNNKDGLHLISGPGYYGGHPHPLRANPTGAGWTRYDDVAGQLVFSVSPTSDWPPVSPSLADPQQGDFRMPGPVSGALLINSASTCGMAEYTASNFGGAMVGDIITTQYSAATVQRVSMNADGTAVTGSSVLLSGSSFGTPLDVACPGPGAAPALSGTIFVGHHSSKITVLEPSDFESAGNVCSGIFSFSLDEDNDGYSNADEISNNSNPCSPAVTPGDRDGDFLSDLLDSDDDNDGIADSQDLFAIDALNGLNIAPPIRRELFNELGTGFFSIGFTGVMLNPGQDYAQLIDEDDLIAGGTAGLFTDPDVGPGNPHGASNTQENAFHFGVSIDQFTGPFLVRSGLGGLLFNGNPLAAQSQGVFIGCGDQDNYVKVAVHADSGPGAIQVVHEEGGVIQSQALYSQAGLFSGNVTLYFRVDPIAGTIHPGFTIGASPITYVGSPLVVGGKVLDVIRGSSAMAFGLLATTGDVLTPTFNATWDYFEVLPIASTAMAKLTINSNAGTLTSSSTNTTGSIEVENLSTGGQKITSVKVDLSTAMLPDVVFDPAGTAGDIDGKPFQLDTFNGTGTPVGTYQSPHDGVGSADGYDVLLIECGPGTDFSPGNLLTFSADIDPTSVKGVAGPGPFHAASISGLELIGATITVTFDDGTVRKMRNAGITGTSNTNKTSVSLLASGSLPTPGLSVPGKDVPFVTSTQPTARIAGPAGSQVVLWTFHSALHLTDGVLSVPGGGYDLDPFESNCVVAYGFTNAVVGANGFVDVPLSLSHTAELGGINLVSAVFVDSNGNRSASSDVLTIDYDPSFTPATALFRVNAGGASYVDTSNQTWTADSGFTSGNTSNFANPIAGTADDALYQTFRYDDSPASPLDYNFTVPNGQYEVKFHFAETWSGVTAAGQRVFDVILEGQVVLDNLDVFAVAGPNTALVETRQVQVTDGQLTIGLRNGVQNPFICGIEVFQLGITGPDTEAPATPGVITFNNLGAGSVNLAWSPSTDNVGVAGYRLFRDEVQIASTTQLSFLNTGLVPSTEYDYAVEAFDIAGNVSGRALVTLTTLADQQNPTMPGAVKGVAGNTLAVLSWNASTDDAGVTGYRVFRDAQLLATVTELAFTDTGLTNGTLYSYEVVAIDASGKTSTPAAVSVRPRALGPAVLRVNCGGASFTDLLGSVWAADYGFNTGVAEVSTGAIAGTNDDGLYQARRFDRSHGAELKYTFPLTDGEYELRLHFAEVWSGASTTPGIRVFDVKVEDQIALDNFDIFAAAGFSTAHVVPIPVTVVGGQLTVEFLRVIQNPTIAAIEVYALEGPPPDTEVPSTPGSLAVTGVTPGSVSLAWTASTDNTAVTGYKISRAGQPVATVQGLAFTESGLSGNTLYQYSVVALDAAGNESVPASTPATTAPDVTDPSIPGSLAGTPGNGVVILSWTASTDDSAVTGYKVLRNAVLLDTVSTPGYTDVGLVNGTGYSYQVIAIDSSGNESEPAAITATPRALGPAFLRVNVGSASSFVDTSGNTWAADFGFNTGYSEASTGAISGTTIAPIYQTRRIDRSSGAELKYQFAVPNGAYEVRLHFAEVWTGAFATGIRVFDVSLEGALALDNLDIFSEVGANAALVKSIPLSITDGQLNIDFQRVIQNPNLSGIEIFPVLGAGAVETVPPTAPGNLAASGLTVSGVTLGWTASTDNVGVMGYRVYRDETLVDTVTGLSFTDSGRTAGAIHQYKVVAFDAAGNESPPASLTVTILVPDTESPSSPLNLVATPALSQMVLAWGASTDNVAVTGYRVLREGILVATVPSPGFTDINLPSGTEFDYEVLAIDGVGNVSGPAQVTSSTLVDSVNPSVPGDFAAVPGFATVGLSWSASTDNGLVTGYRIRRNAVLIATVPTPGFLDTGRIPGTTYNYSVAAVDSADNESAPAALTVSTLADETAPSVPGILDAVPGDQVVALTWNASTDNVGVSGYEIRRNGSVIATVPAPGYTDSGRVNGTVYTYEVRALDLAGNVSAAVTAAATPRVLGSALVRVNAGGEGFVDGSGNTWYSDYGFNIGSTSTSAAAIAGTEDDQLYQSERFDGSPNGDSLLYAFDLPNGHYEVKLHFAEVWSGASGAGLRVFDINAEGNLAVNDMDIFARVGGNHACSTTFPVSVSDGQLNIGFVHGVQNPKICGIEVFEIVDVVDPSAPAGLATSNITGSSVQLTWAHSTDNVAVTGYRIYLGAVEIGNVSVPAFTATSLATGTEHTFSVVAFDAAGNESPPAVVRATTLVPDTEAPSAPLNLVATPATTSVTLLWQAATDNVAVTGYRVVRGTDTIADNLTALTWTDTGLASGAAFNYQVFALDAAGNVSPFAGVATNTLVPPSPFEQWLINNNLTGQTAGDSDKGGLDNLTEFELQMDPNDSSDDLGFRLRCTTLAGNPLITLPVLKPIGNYHLHRDTDLTDIGNVANRIDTVTKAEIEAMTPEQRAAYSVPDPAGGPRAFYQLIFEPVAN